MDAFESKIYSFIREKSMLCPAETVVVGFSGGADSTALLNVLYELKDLLDIRPVAVHVNHCIREDAGHDEQFAVNYCKDRSIECQVVTVDIPRLSKEWNMTEEEAGRKARYEAFTDAAAQYGACKIAVAHHQNDVAETLLMNLFRGSGLHGAGAIRPVRDNVIRPLLCVTRAEIEEYLRGKDLSFCVDSTNDENIHTRNIVRNILLPAIEKDVNSAAVAHLYRSALEFAKADDYISEKADEAYERAVTVGNAGVHILSAELGDEPEVIKSNVILKCLEVLTPRRKDITAAHVDSILELMKDTRGCASVDLPYNLVAKRSYNEIDICFKKEENINKKEADSDASFAIPGGLEAGQSLQLEIPKLGVANISIMQYNDGKLFPSSAYTKWFDYDRIQEAVFRVRQAEDYILIEQNGGYGKKKIAKLMTDEKIPVSERDNMYILVDGNNCIWVPGYRMSAAYKITSTTKRILEIKILDNGGNLNG